MHDGKGFCGFVFHYALLFALFGSSALALFYCWRKKRLDMDEAPKYTLFAEDDDDG